MRKILPILLIFQLALMLQSCMNVATTGAQAVYNRHSIQKSIDDQYVTMQAFQGLHHKTDKFKNANIVVTTYNQEVLLAGQAPEEWQKAKAEEIVKNVPGVKRVYNVVSIANPSSVLTKMSDAWITAKVKARFIASEEVDPTQIKVVTENGVVYLMGILKPNQAEEAVELARTTHGVMGVVKIFSYVHISRKA